MKCPYCKGEFDKLEKKKDGSAMVLICPLCKTFLSAISAPPPLKIKYK
jgi:uncharacterized protein YbaR (Trm112 family)